MQTQDVVRHFGSIAAAARTAGISLNTAYRWPHDGYVAEWAAARLDRLTGGVLVYDHTLYMSLPKGVTHKKAPGV